MLTLAILSSISPLQFLYLPLFPCAWQTIFFRRSLFSGLPDLPKSLLIPFPWVTFLPPQYRQYKCQLTTVALFFYIFVLFVLFVPATKSPRPPPVCWLGLCGKGTCVNIKNNATCLWVLLSIFWRFCCTCCLRKYVYNLPNIVSICHRDTMVVLC